MDRRHLYFFFGLLLLMLLCGYVRDLGARAGISATKVALLERLALLG
jgi:hypothetical protein